MSFIGGLNGHYICSIFKAVGETPSLPPINLDKFIEQHINLAFLRAGMCEPLPALNWKTWNGINWLALDKLMANTVFMMCSYSPSFD